MTTIDFITELFCRVDDPMRSVRKHAQAVLWPSEVVTLGLLHAFKFLAQPTLLGIVDSRCRLGCAVQRHGLSGGVSPLRQLSLRPVATGAVVEVTKRLKPLV